MLSFYLTTLLQQQISTGRKRQEDYHESCAGTSLEQNGRVLCERVLSVQLFMVR